MKKLFTFLSRANNNSVAITSNYRRVSSICPIRTFVVVFMIALAPSAMKGQSTTINFSETAVAAQRATYDSNYATEFVMSDNYEPIGNNAKKGVRIDYRWNSGISGYNRSVDISHLAFRVNASGNGNSHNTSDGFYLRREGSGNTARAGLYTGQQGAKIAVVGLFPGDKVTFNAQCLVLK